MAIHRRDAHPLVRAALSTLLGGLLVVGVAGPSLAQPGDVPDAGSRPAPEGEVRLPDGSYAAPAPRPREGPLSAEIAEVELNLNRVTTELDTLAPESGPAGNAVALAEATWHAATEELTAAEVAFEEEVGEAYRENSGVPERLFGQRLRDIRAHVPVNGVHAAVGAEAAARRLLQAQQNEQAAATALAETRAAEQTLAEDIAKLEDDLAGLENELTDLVGRNRDLLEEQRREEQAAEQRRADNYPVIEPVDGMLPGKAARRAVAEALKHLGKPYVWGAEGPDQFDCSGLVLYSYRKAGVNSLPRVAADQYFGTRDRTVARSVAVAQRGLLPGDLIFYSPNAFDHRAIGHVVMYIGNGRVVQAPSTGDVVKISPIWWSNFFAATRVVDAVRDPNAPDPADPRDPGSRDPRDPSNPGNPQPSPTPGPQTPGPGSPSPNPPGSPSPSPAPSPSSPTPGPGGTSEPPEPGGEGSEPPESPSPTPDSDDGPSPGESSGAESPGGESPGDDSS